MTAPMETSRSLPIYCFFRLALLYCKLLPMNSEKLDPWRPPRKEKIQIRDSEIRWQKSKSKQKQKKIDETRYAKITRKRDFKTGIRNASEISASFDSWNRFCILVSNCCCFSRYHARSIPNVKIQVSLCFLSGVLTLIHGREKIANTRRGSWKRALNN